MAKIPVVLFAIVFTCLPSFTRAQTAPAKSQQIKQPSSAVKNEGETSAAPSKTPSNAESERQLRIKRTQARSLLVSLASDARTFQDQTLRARSLARIADVLWEVDAEQSRLLFRKAWEAAEVADQESDEKVQEEIRQQKARSGGGFAVNLPPNIRREVLKLTARHDRLLGEEFLEKLKLQKQETAKTKLDNFRLPEALKQRLALARELLEPPSSDRIDRRAAPARSSTS